MSSKPATSRVKVGCTEDKKKECEKRNMKCYEETGVCHHLKFFEKKSTSKSLKPAPEVQKKTPSSAQKQEEIKTTKTIHDFIKELKKYKTAKEAIEKIFKDDDNAVSIIKELNEKDKENTKSRQGFIYELLWDICIKFNITNFTNKHTEHGTGNFNIFSNFEKIQKHFNEYLKQGYISGNSGGYSDITFRTKQEETDMNYDLNLVSVKYYQNDNKKDITKYDIQKLCTLIDDRKNDNYNSINTLLFVKNKEDFKKICKSANQSSNVLIKYISPHGNYENVYDLQDLEKHYSKLWKILDDFNFLKDVNDFKENYLQIYKKKFIPRFHQELFIEKITSLIKKEQKKILVGAIPRSGKTYIMAGTILKDVEDTKDKTKFNNYLIITPAPNETLKQYYEAFDDYYDFKNNNIVPINVKDVEIGKETEKIEFKGEAEKHNVFLISKQRLGFRDKEDNDKEDNKIYNKIYDDKDYIEKIRGNIKKYFGDNKFKFIFFDEAHFGMSTRIAQDIFSELDIKDESYKIYVTATYNKPKQIYNVDDKNIIKWDLQDIRLIKNIEDKSHYKTLEYFKEKFGTKIFNKVVKNQKNTIIEQYKHFPEPILLTSVWDKDFVDSEIKKIGENETFGFDMHKLFMPNKTNNEFINKEQLIQLLEYYFGYYTDDDGKDDNSKRKKDNKEKFYETKNEYEKRGILPNIEKTCLNNCRTLQPEHKTTQLWFLPPYEISKITKSLIELLKNKFNYIFNNYMFYVAVEGVKGQKSDPNVKYLQKPADIKKEIEKIEKDLYTNTEYSKYEGLIILAGSRLQLGISLKNVDIVALFTHITASDAIYQMIFRSMTEIEDDIECDGKSYCGRKKYGFMVDLNPQRTLFTIDYLTDMYLDNDRFKGQNREKKMELIADLINIDKRKFIDRYNRENKKGYENYAKEFFGKLYKAWDAKTENIQRLLLDKHLFDRDIFEPDYNIKELFIEIEKEKKQKKHKIDKPDNEVQKGKIKKTIHDIIKPEKGKKNPNSNELWAYLFAEIISILSLITSYTDKDGNACIFNLENKDNFLYELKQIIENVIDKDDDIKHMLLYTLKKRIIIKDSIEDNQLYNMINNAIDNMEEKQRGGNLLELNKQIQLRKSKIYSIKEPDELLKYINDNLKPKKVEKDERGEVFTPMELVNEMLNKLPDSVWKNPNLKWLDPAAGMGNFPVAVYMRLMEGLKSVIDEEEERRKHILENMLYMVELDETNVFMMKKIFCCKLSKSSKKGYDLKIFEGSFIDKRDKKYKKIDFDLKFDIILGNPPFQYKKPGYIKAQQIWHYFIKRSYEELLKEKGYLLFVHPSGWRDIDGDYKEIFNYIKEHNLIYLSMNTYKDGQRVFGGAGTNFDYYVIQNIKTNNNITKVSDIDNIENIEKNNYNIDLNDWDFIPSGKLNLFQKLLTKKEKVNVLYERSMYGTDKNNMMDNKMKNVEIKNDIFKYPVIYTITQKDGCNILYSKEKKGHFGIPKVIWSNGAGTYPIIDEKGKYGLTQFAYAIVDNKQNLQKIKDAMISEKFIDLMKYLVFKKDNKYNYKIIALFKKDFYKYFLPKRGNKSVSLPKKSKSNKLHKRNKSI